MTTTHKCPGGCGRAVAADRFACPICRGRLPWALQQPILAAYRRDPAAYAEATASARKWYRDHPRGGRHGERHGVPALTIHTGPGDAGTPYTPPPHTMEDVHRAYLALLIAELDGDHERAHAILHRDGDPGFATKVAHYAAHKMVSSVEVGDRVEMRADLTAELRAGG